jgi:toxin ParE1/3/4
MSSDMNIDMSTEWKVEYTKGAKNNISDIYRYIADVLLEPENAASQADRIIDAISELDHMPYRYPVYTKATWRGKKMRYLPVDNYIVFYYPYETVKKVRIIRVMYGGRDIQTHLM